MGLRFQAAVGSLAGWLRKRGYCEVAGVQINQKIVLQDVRRHRNVSP